MIQGGHISASGSFHRHGDATEQAAQDQVVIIPILTKERCLCASTSDDVGPWSYGRFDAGALIILAHATTCDHESRCLLRSQNPRPRRRTFHTITLALRASPQYIQTR